DVLERNRNHARAHFAMGMLGRCQGRLVESQIALERAIALDRNFASAMLQLGYTLNELGEPEAALPHFEKARELSPRDQNIVYRYAGLGSCHLLLGHADQAVELLRRAYAENSRIWYIPLLLAAALGLRGDVDDARAMLDELRKLRPEMNSFAGLRTNMRTMSSPQYAALVEKTVNVGLRRAGLPDE